MSIAKDIIAGLEGFVQKLKNNEPIEVTQVRRVETPDGPMHIRKKLVLKGTKPKENDEARRMGD